MYFGIAILSLNLACSTCYVAYEMFQGFDASPSNSTFTTETYIIPINVTTYQTSLQTAHQNTIPVTNNTSSPPSATFSQEATTLPVLPVTSSKFKCPEEEQPSNIGAYEVPTQRDFVLLVRTTLIRMFNSYHEKALYFLKDIKEAAKSTASIERKCHGYGTDRESYKKCVWQVSNKCEVITKGLVTSLESQRQDVSAFTNGNVCSLKGMKADPVELIKTLAMEEASLEFALPGFLRLLSACSIYCIKMEPQQRPKKPLRHMTDQDLVVKHFLTKKNYIQLLKGSK